MAPLAGALPRPLLPRCAAPSVLRSPSSVSMAPLPRRRWRPLLSLPPEGVPGELMEEESKFVPLNPEDPMYGPPALLLIGFEGGETCKVQEFLKELDGEFLKVIQCTEQMTKQTLWDAMHTDQPSLEAVKIAKSMLRICIFSGLTGEEVMMFINAFPETGLHKEEERKMIDLGAEQMLRNALLLAKGAREQQQMLLEADDQDEDEERLP